MYSSQTNCNCYQDQQVTQEAGQSTETTSKTESKDQEGENTADVSGNDVAYLPKLPGKYGES